MAFFKKAVWRHKITQLDIVENRLDKKGCSRPGAGYIIKGRKRLIVIIGSFGIGSQSTDNHRLNATVIKKIILNHQMRVGDSGFLIARFFDLCPEQIPLMDRSGLRLHRILKSPDFCQRFLPGAKGKTEQFPA